jgi:hypothetical protein
MSQLTPPIRRQLLAAFDTLSILDTSAGRDQLVADLPIPLRASIRRNPAKTTDLETILSACDAWVAIPGQPEPLRLLLDTAQALATGSATAAALATLQAALGASPPPAGSNPYRSLDPFHEADAPFFFGREVFITHLVTAVQDQPLVAVLGPSGCGKSSVIYAGLVPALRADPAWGLPPGRATPSALVDSPFMPSRGRSYPCSTRG